MDKIVQIKYARGLRYAKNKICLILGIDEDDVYGRYCIDEAATYLYNMMQPDKEGKTKKPIFREDEIESKTKNKNPGLDLLMS